MFTILAVPSLLIRSNFLKSEGLKDIKAAQWYTCVTLTKANSNEGISKISPFTQSILSKSESASVV